MNTVNLSLEEYNRLRDIDLNLEKYRKEADERKYKVKIVDKDGYYSYMSYQTNDEFIEETAKKLQEANSKIKDLEDKIKEHEKSKLNFGPVIGFESKRKKFLGIF